jgi:penicillin-binding protein 2
MGLAAGVRHSGMGRQPAWLLAVVLLFSGAMVLRLAWLQLHQGAENRQRADENRIRLVPRNPIRGRLLDRQGRVLATAFHPEITGDRRVHKLFVDIVTGRA